VSDVGDMEIKHSCVFQEHAFQLRSLMKTWWYLMMHGIHFLTPFFKNSEALSVMVV